MLKYELLLSHFADLSTRQDPIQHPDSSVNETARRERENYRSAAVLIPVSRLDSHQQSNVVLTVRSENLRSHAGQISLPGGTTEAEDADEVATALRESEEEIGLLPADVEIIGKLGEMPLPSGFRVTPVIGLINNGLEFVPNPGEVADIFQVPLELILDPSAYTRSSVEFKNKQREILEIHYEDYRIWGATAAILHHLAKRISGEL